MIDGSLCRSGPRQTYLRVKRAVRWWERLRGLLGTPAAPDDGLYITPCCSVHTVGMRYPVDLIFLDRDGRVLRIAEAVPPWRIAGAWRAHAVAEFRAGTLRRLDVAVGDRLTWRAQRGQSATEFIIVLPVLLLVILGALQVGLLYRAKSTLNLATFQAARIGAMHYGRETEMRAELANGLAALYAKDWGWNQLIDGRARAQDVVKTYATLATVNPPAQFHSQRISNNRLRYQTDAQGGLSVQDLNVLKIKVVYCHPLQVPLIAKTLQTVLAPRFTGFERACLDAGRMPLASSAVVRMHTDYCPELCP
ncbi:MAG TPA: DUF192 domain-containing protein [Burkholderiales bacterium]|nr:DUF192 domain-containing protein [Burkholderiales bacterium]